MTGGLSLGISVPQSHLSAQEKGGFFIMRQTAIKTTPVTVKALFRSVVAHLPQLTHKQETIMTPASFQHSEGGAR